MGLPVSRADPFLETLMEQVNWHIRLGILPHAKARPRVTTARGFATAYTPKASKDWEKKLARITSSILTEHNIQPFEGAVSLIVQFYLPRAKTKSAKSRKIQYPTLKPDIDNYIKATMDGINGIAFVDDCQVVDLFSGIRYVSHETPPELHITLFTPEIGDKIWKEISHQITNNATLLE